MRSYLTKRPREANERAKQKKDERKRLKRDLKKAALRVLSARAEPLLQPMSMTLKKFADPLLDRLPDPDSYEQWKLVLNLAAMVWNAGEDEPNAKLLRTGKKVFEALGWKEDVAEELRRLQARKKAHFSWEPRLIAGVKVEDRDDTIHVVALSKLP